MFKISPLLLALCITAAQAGSSDNVNASQLRMSTRLSMNVSETSNSNITIERVFLGSGLQNATGTENANPVADFGVLHAPQYMPGFPTAATIWPRVVNVRCSNHVCSGYTITPEMGRGEYLFFKPINAD